MRGIWNPAGEELQLMKNDIQLDHAEKARALFLEGYNCSQAVFCAFEDLTGLDRETSARLSSAFGGGMGRLREDWTGRPLRVFPPPSAAVWVGLGKSAAQ